MYWEDNKHSILSSIRRTNNVTKRRAYYTACVIEKETEAKTLKKLTEQRERNKRFYAGIELAKNGVSRESITDAIMLKGYDKQMRLLSQTNELTRQLKK